TANFNPNLTERENRSDQMDQIDDFEGMVKEKQVEAATAILKAWMKCNETFKVPFDDGVALFANIPDDGRHVNTSVKCLVDCTIRETGLMTDDDRLDSAKYLAKISELRFNYLDYKEDETKLQILEAIYKTSVGFAENCYSMEDPHGNMDEFLRKTCFDLIKAYKESVNHCEGLKDPKDDKCATSWMILRCIMKKNREQSFQSPFYPVRLNEF
ncbi:hypothetical protein Bhyg_03423, partial [Pseudolycoriella hygida]